MFYNDPVKSENGRLILCPICGNEEFSDGAQYCRICGVPCVNYCLPDNPDFDPRHINSGNARYCEICGAQTEFFVHKLLKPWNDIRDAYQKEANLQESSSGGFTPVETDELPF